MKRIVTLAAAALLWAGCNERSGSERREANATVSDHQERSEQALDRASEAQERASREQQEAQDARSDIEKEKQEVVDAQKQLEEAEARAAKETDEARQVQEQASAETQAAQQEATESQRTAQQLQEQQRSQAEQQNAQTQVGVGGSGMEEPTAPEQAAPQPEPLTSRPFTGDQANITGTVEKSDPGQLVIRQEDGQLTTLAIHPQTQVLVDGQARSLDQLQEGSEIRASFDPSSGEKGQARLEIESLAAGQQPAPQQQPQQ